MNSQEISGWVEVRDQDQIDSLLNMESTVQVVSMQPGSTPVFDDETVERLKTWGAHEVKRFFILTSGSVGQSAWLATTATSLSSYETLRRQGFRTGDRLVGIFETDEAAVSYSIKLNERRKSSAA